MLLRVYCTSCLSHIHGSTNNYQQQHLIRGCIMSEQIDKIRRADYAGYAASHNFQEMASHCSPYSLCPRFCRLSPCFPATGLTLLDAGAKTYVRHPVNFVCMPRMVRIHWRCTFRTKNRENMKRKKTPSDETGTRGIHLYVRHNLLPTPHDKHVLRSLSLLHTASCRARGFYQSSRGASTNRPASRVVCTFEGAPSVEKSVPT